MISNYFPITLRNILGGFRKASKRVFHMLTSFSKTRAKEVSEKKEPAERGRQKELRRGAKEGLTFCKHLVQSKCI